MCYRARDMRDIVGVYEPVSDTICDFMSDDDRRGEDSGFCGDCLRARGHLFVFVLLYEGDPDVVIM